MPHFVGTKDHTAIIEDGNVVRVRVIMWNGIKATKWILNGWDITDKRLVFVGGRYLIAVCRVSSFKRKPQCHQRHAYI